MDLKMRFPAIALPAEGCYSKPFAVAGGFAGNPFYKC
jgi:hypothetical protein